MSNRDHDKDKAGSSDAGSKLHSAGSGRSDRLADALRANLKKRKAQMRARAGKPQGKSED